MTTGLRRPCRNSRRLVVSLDAGQQAGGDSRGKQSAAILIVKEKGGYGGFNRGKLHTNKAASAFTDFA